MRPIVLIVLVDAIMKQRPQETLRLEVPSPIAFDTPRLSPAHERPANPTAPIPERIRRRSRRWNNLG